MADFNFNQPPRKPVLLPTNPPTDSLHIPAYYVTAPPCLGCTAPPPASTSRQTPVPAGHTIQPAARPRGTGK
ncbi:MAG TPA: hypothetical protein VGS62_00540 [Streptosporangiaceae bacterium]|nr:hypothetical protein [Streptosporangiaceae bacterium]